MAPSNMRFLVIFVLTASMLVFAASAAQATCPWEAIMKLCGGNATLLSDCQSKMQKCKNSTLPTVIQRCLPRKLYPFIAILNATLTTAPTTPGDMTAAADLLSILLGNKEACATAEVTKCVKALPANS
nr:uncharacterized protein LOC123747349 [Procambarus clarkii]